MEKLWVLRTAFGNRMLGGVIKKKKIPRLGQALVAGTIHTGPGFQSHFCDSNLSSWELLSFTKIPVKQKTVNEKFKCLTRAGIP